MTIISQVVAWVEGRVHLALHLNKITIHTIAKRGGGTSANYNDHHHPWTDSLPHSRIHCLIPPQFDTRALLLLPVIVVVVKASSPFSHTAQLLLVLLGGCSAGSWAPIKWSGFWDGRTEVIKIICKCAR